MPRIRKSLPPDRAEYSFGDLIYWHLFVYGTRPTGDPEAAAGREWKIGEFCEAVDVTDRTLRNWIAGKSYPDSTAAIVQALFGDNRRFDPWRTELKEAARIGRQRGFQKFPETGAAGAAPQPDSEATDADAVEGDQPDLSGGSSARDGSGDGRRAGVAALVPYARSREHESEARRDTRTIHPVWMTRPADKQRGAWAKQSSSVVVSGLVILAGLYAWMRPSPDRPSHAPPVTTTKPEPVPAAPKPVVTHAQSEDKLAAPIAPTPEVKPRQETAAKPEAPAAAPPPPSQLPPQATAKPVPPSVAPPPAPVDAQRAAAMARDAEQKRITQEVIHARQAAHDAEVRAAEDAARRSDRDPDDAATAQRERETVAHQIAGIGYRLMENTSVASGASLAPILVDSAADCALACLRATCDAFTFSGAPHSGTANYCYRYRGPVTFRAEPLFRAGRRLAESAPSQVAAAEPGAAVPSTVIAQAAPTAPVAEKVDDLVRCANGPVKVTGFKLTCDSILGGGTTLGSTQLRYTVANINQCAAKCRPIMRCVGFTYNAADPDGQHSCEIFGPTPEMRTVNGYVSGMR